MANKLYTGWAEIDITPDDRTVELCGQYYQRVATEIHSRLKGTILLLEQGKECSVMISLDVTGIPADLCQRIQQSITKVDSNIKPHNIIINATHTHNAPALFMFRKWWTPVPEAISVEEYSNFIEEKILQGIQDAWTNKQLTGLLSSQDYISIGHCRRVTYTDKTAEMYGQTNRLDFAGLEGGEDSAVKLLFFCDQNDKPTGMIINVACPSQVMEATYKISSDFMGALREKLKHEFGSDFKTLPQISAAGCQAPRDLVHYSDDKRFWNEQGVEIISDELLTSIKRAWQTRKDKLDFSPSLSHQTEVLSLNKRHVSYQEYITAKTEMTRLEDIQDSKTAYNDFCKTVHHHEQIPGRPGPYDDKNMHFVQIRNNEAVVKRYEEQLEHPQIHIQLHVLRLGNNVFATNPFELFLDFGQRIIARSQADQTYLIQLANGCEGYLPSRYAEELGGYGALVINGKVGSDEGSKLVDKTVEIINKLVDERN